MKHDDTRQKILEVATRLFSKYGFKKTSVDEIARAAHKAKGSVYYHFPGKEDLFREVVEMELNQVKSELARIAGEDSDTAMKLRRYLTTRMLLMGHAVNYHETLKADLLEQLDFVEEVKDSFYQFETGLVKDMLKEGIQNGTFIELDYEMVAELYVLVCIGLEMPFYLQKRYLQYAVKLEQLSSILFDGLLK
jgi:AcrR family transcriptional regulator